MWSSSKFNLWHWVYWVLALYKRRICNACIYIDVCMYVQQQWTIAWAHFRHSLSMVWFGAQLCCFMLYSTAILCSSTLYILSCHDDRHCLHNLHFYYNNRARSKVAEWRMYAHGNMLQHRAETNYLCWWLTRQRAELLSEILMIDKQTTAHCFFCVCETFYWFSEMVTSN